VKNVESNDTMWTASKIKVYLHALWGRLVRRDPAKISASYAGTDECLKPRMDAESTGATNAACGLRYAACRTCHSDLNLMFSFQRKLLGTGTVLPVQSCRSVEWLVSEGEVSGESRSVIILTDRSDGLDALTPKHQLKPVVLPYVVVRMCVVVDGESGFF
jgi:hypothetical protein